MEVVSTAAAPYHYLRSGLPNVFLLGVKRRHCQECAVETVAIPRLGQLHEVIARVLLEKPAGLTGAELRFLRKHVGLSAVDFSGQLQKDPSTLSRIENGQQSLGVSTDKLARAIVLAEIEHGDHQDLKTTASAFLRRKQRFLKPRKKAQETQLEFASGTWRERVAA
ncbi:MAG TPA: helix-turn-helix domain-containing protein [Candidatus Polarisedimenticolia bacterium]|nr:helix-turn-helix domain-containing protein [Candidatus Polarisedimenticolia bacterium]